MLCGETSTLKQYIVRVYICIASLEEGKFGYNDQNSRCLHPLSPRIPLLDPTGKVAYAYKDVCTITALKCPFRSKRLKITHLSNNRF